MSTPSLDDRFCEYPSLRATVAGERPGIVLLRNRKHPPSSIALRGNLHWIGRRGVANFLVSIGPDVPEQNNSANLVFPRQVSLFAQAQCPLSYLSGDSRIVFGHLLDFTVVP
jgi:hypothetical protein